MPHVAKGTSTAAELLHKQGELAARTILEKWNGPDLAAACHAALELGHLASKMLPYHRCRSLLDRNLELNKVNKDQWPEAVNIFHQGRETTLTRNDVWRRYISAPANDNNRFAVTWFDDVDQSAAKEEIVSGVLGAGEFSLFVAKPGTAKSVLVGDIGCHIAAGLDWHGRKVKQGLVVFFAAERKKLTERRVAAWAKKHDVSGIPFVVVGGKL